MANQPLSLFSKDVNQLSFNQYLWSPATGLSNSFSPNPVAVLQNNITYHVIATSPEGCIGTDSISITVFKEIAIHVPNAFTPNNDGLNDILKAIPVGIKEFKFFTIYDRWGKQVFTTTDYHKGWDGNNHGIGLAGGNYIWIAGAIDYKGQGIDRKGTVLLLR